MISFLDNVELQVTITTRDGQDLYLGEKSEFVSGYRFSRPLGPIQAFVVSAPHQRN